MVSKVAVPSSDCVSENDGPDGERENVGDSDKTWDGVSDVEGVGTDSDEVASREGLSDTVSSSVGVSDTDGEPRDWVGLSVTIEDPVSEVLMLSVNNVLVLSTVGDSDGVPGVRDG
jgi:hypothetical protein